MSAGSVQLSKRAVQDLGKLQARDRARIADGLRELAAEAENVDVKPLVGVAPWLRMRIGGWRVLYRPATEQEAAQGAA